ncbi:MAG: cupin domain-containing protein [Muribaculaceae bacterium]|nr:cupin domain-containing protein [Muribaculaceae bacterium]
MLNTEFKFGEVHVLADQIQTAEDRPQFRNLFANANGGVVLVGLKAGQKLDTHTAPAELMVNVIEGEIEFTMLDRPHIIKAGEFFLMGADVTHSVVAKADSKIMLVKVRP